MMVWSESFYRNRYSFINIFSMFQLAYLLAAPFVGAKLGKIGRKTAIIVGYLLIIIATVGFGLLSYIADNNEYIFSN